MDKWNESIRKLEHFYDTMSITNRITKQNGLQQQNFNTMTRNMQ